MKGIDSLFSRGLAPILGENKFFTKDSIKANLQSVVKEGPKITKSNNLQKNDVLNSALSKSRLRNILEKNKDAQIKSVVRRDNSKSVSPYQRISVAASNSPHKV
jgi:hypothetical protein